MMSSSGERARVLGLDGSEDFLWARLEMREEGTGSVLRYRLLPWRTGCR